jgi:hypothetical protein
MRLSSKKPTVVFSASLALVAAAACTSAGGGATCFPPEHGPSDVSCAAFSLGLMCPVDVQPGFYSCTCTAADAGQTWICTPTDAPGSGGGGGSGAGGAGTGGDAGADTGT